MVEVVDCGDERSLYFSGHVLQSSMSRSSPHKLILSYTQYMMATLLFSKPPKRVLIIGLGGGSLLRFIHHHFPTCVIEAIDFSQHIINLAKGYFQLPATSSIIIHNSDGFKFLAGLSAEHSYDLILIDAFDGNGMSPSIYHSEFFRLCQKSLRQNGLISVNLWSGKVERMEAVKKDLADHFNSIAELPVPQRGNVICLAGKDLNFRNMMERDKAKLVRLSTQFGIDFKCIGKIYRRHNLNFRQRVASFFLVYNKDKFTRH